MKKTILISLSVILLSIFILAELVQAQGNSDKGPLTKKVFIHYKNPQGRTNNQGKRPPKPPQDETGTYAYMVNGLKWKHLENFILNPDGAPRNTDKIIAAGMSTWENAAGTQIFGNVGTNNSAIVDLSKTDNVNAIVFEPLNDDQIIAVTYVWGYFYGPPQTREIVEVDMIFNTDDWLTWGTVETDGNDVMDILNIATHELGHAAGMDDLYNATTILETMYGYSTEGEIIKRDLYYGDIAGISNLY